MTTDTLFATPCHARVPRGTNHTDLVPSSMCRALAEHAVDELLH
jgi:hypothetical protein